MNQHRISIAFCLILASCLHTAQACNVPVFRYALERWPADLYEVVVLHHGKLDGSQQQVVETLRAHSRSSGGHANFNLHLLAADEIEDEVLRVAWQQHGADGQPVLALLYPRKATEVPERLVSAGPLNEQAARRLVQSPAREQLLNKLLSGDSAVWIFVPGGDQQENANALQRLNQQVKKNEHDLELPPQDEIEADEFFRIENPIELRLGFSVIQLDRDDPSEAALLAMLLGSEPDLKELDEPMAFPVIGRGRVLYALVGKGIFPETITSASRFVVGPCSCQVKEQNPGFDLLLTMAWDEKLGGSLISEPAPDRSDEPVLIEIPRGK